MLALVEMGEPDRGLLPDDAQQPARDFLTELQGIVDAGPEAFGEAQVGALLGGSALLVEALANTDCAAVTAG